MVIVNGRRVEQLGVTFIEFYIDSAWCSVMQPYGPVASVTAGPGRPGPVLVPAMPGLCCWQLLVDDSCHYLHHVGLRSRKERIIKTHHGWGVLLDPG